MPLQRQAEYKRAGVEEGIASTAGKEATKSFVKLLKWIEESTERGPWLAGREYSLADIAATPYMVRLEMLQLTRMWDHKPGVAKWWEQIKSLRGVYSPKLDSLRMILRFSGVAVLIPRCLRRGSSFSTVL